MSTRPGSETPHVVCIEEAWILAAGTMFALVLSTMPATAEPPPSSGETAEAPPPTAPEHAASPADTEIEARLRSAFEQVSGLEKVDVEVRAGVAILSGRAAGASAIDDAEVDVEAMPEIDRQIEEDRAQSEETDLLEQ